MRPNDLDEIECVHKGTRGDVYGRPTTAFATSIAELGSTGNFCEEF